MPVLGDLKLLFILAVTVSAFLISFIPTILQYKINNAGKSFVNTIYITYAEGRIEN